MYEGIKEYVLRFPQSRKEWRNLPLHIMRLTNRSIFILHKCILVVLLYSLYFQTVTSDLFVRDRKCRLNRMSTDKEYKVIAHYTINVL